MLCYILREAVVDACFYSRFLFKLSFFFMVFSTWKWLVSYDNHLTMSNITIRNSLENSLVSNIAILLHLYSKSAILGLSFLDPRDFCLPNQFSGKSWQTYSVSILFNLVSKKKFGSFNDGINTHFQSLKCLSQYEHFLASMFRKVSLVLLNRIHLI